MSLLSKLFGGGSPKKEAPKPDPVDHAGFLIFPDPIPEGGQFRIAARIEKDIDGETRVHTLVRADLIRSLDEAVEASVFKAKQMIDQMGDRIFS